MSQGNTHVLPDSRLVDRKDTVVVDWPTKKSYYCDNGVLVYKPSKTIRLELEPIYCFNCGKDCGYVPVDIMSFVSWLCDSCSLTWGGSASLHTAPDQAFWDAVSHEVYQKFGRTITKDELDALANQGKLGHSLELLNRESPYVQSKS